MSEQQCIATTASGEQCRNRAMRGSDRCGAHTSRHVGRPTVLDDDVADRLLVMLRAGNYLNVAVLAAGIGMQTYRDWMRRGQSSKIEDLPYRELREKVERARAEGEVRHVAVIARAASGGDWRAALVLLEREYPERWGPVSVRTRDVEPPPLPVETPIDPDDPFREVDELAERRRSRVAG